MKKYKAFEILFGNNLTIEEKISKAGTPYIMVKRNFKGQDYLKDYIKKTTHHENPNKGEKFQHGFIIWFNKKGIAIKPHVVTLFKNTPGFNQKHYNELNGQFTRDQALAYAKQFEGKGKWCTRFKFLKPVAYIRKCKNGTIQSIGSDWWVSKTYPIRFFSKKPKSYSPIVSNPIKYSICHMLNQMQLDGERAKTLTKLLVSEMLSRMEKMEIKNDNT